ncbi:MAG: hypothetical protein AB7H88_19010 [Vicinamibacterales bacterium]
MAADPGLIARLDALIEAFHRRSLDLPDGLFDRRTQFLLNGAPFESLLGRPPGDPLVLMLARGPAGYRFVMKAVQHALPDASLVRGVFDGAGDAVSGECWLSGRLRGADTPFDGVFAVTLTLGPAGVVQTAAVTMDAASVAALDAARKSAE